MAVEVDHIKSIVHNDSSGTLHSYTGYVDKTASGGRDSRIIA